MLLTLLQNRAQPAEVYSGGGVRLVRRKQRDPNERVPLFPSPPKVKERTLEVVAEPAAPAVEIPAISILPPLRVKAPAPDTDLDVFDLMALCL